MAHVLIVSNRLPVSVSKVDGKLQFSSSIGGLATALASYTTGRQNKWVGWPGIASDDLTEKDRKKITTELAKQHCVPVFLTQKQLDDYYNGYSNSLLWPLFHDLSFKDDPAHERWWKAYKAVNQIFADAVLSVAQPNTVIWVHDYQLMLLPRLIRQQSSLALTPHIGFFLHIPFPKPKVMEKLPKSDRLLKGLLGADLIGFHTKGYVKNFSDYSQQAGITQLNDQLVVGGRTVRATDFPIGIDYQKFTDAKKLPAVKRAVKEFKRKYRGKKIIASVDRLDISKGFVERLTAYREFLVQNPKLHRKVVFVLVGAPSRTDIEAYQKLAQKVANLAAKINAQFGTPRWQPVDYIDQAIPFEQVTALFSIADVAFITPLRDGMNLAAKEFVASNQTGVLVLSETAGAADELRDALLVNPRKPDSSVAALQQALTMPKHELKKRLKTMQHQISDNNVHTWASSFVKSLQQPIPEALTRIRTRSLKGPLELQFISDYQLADQRLLLLDYDGTLRPFERRFTESVPSASLLKLLKKLSDDPRNTVVIISGRGSKDLGSWFGDMRVNLVAEHGAMTKSATSKSWHTLERAESQWKHQITPVLQKYAKLTPGAEVEVKPHSLVWHYRQSPSYYAQKYAVVLKQALKPFLKSHGLKTFQGSKILEIKDPTINKGDAIKSWLRQDHDFILAIGDDYTDEDMFTTIPETAHSIKVGLSRTTAKYRLPDSKAVVSLLRKLSSQT